LRRSSRQASKLSQYFDALIVVAVHLQGKKIEPLQPPLPRSQAKAHQDVASHHDIMARSSTLSRSGKAPKITSVVSDHLLRAPWCGTELFLQFLEPLSHRLDRLEEATVHALAIRIDLILVLHRFEIVDDDGDEQVDDDEDGQ
jgi:hypothetical protein